MNLFGGCCRNIMTKAHAVHLCGFINIFNIGIFSKLFILQQCNPMKIEYRNLNRIVMLLRWHFAK